MCAITPEICAVVMPAYIERFERSTAWRNSVLNPHLEPKSLVTDIIMDLTKVEGVKVYLERKNIPFKNVTYLPGGSGNFIWLIEDVGHPKTILKHAEPYVKSNPQLAFPQERMDFEARAIQQLGSAAAFEDASFVALPTIAPPTVHSYDQENHTLLMNYGGSRNLKEAYQDPALEVPGWGRRIGAWLATLHQSTEQTDIGDNKAGREIYRYAYAGLERTFKKWGMEEALGKRINDRYGAMLSTDNECVCHGDCWPGNFLVSDEIDRLTVVDWEMTRRGNGATDVGQFAAEAFLLDRFCGGRGLMPAFIEAYRDTTAISKDFAERIAVNFGTHLAFWPSYVEWGTEEETFEVVSLGAEFLVRVELQDWDWLRKSVLGTIFSSPNA